jgi:fluoride ion exporter CrcB/FEX
VLFAVHRAGARPRRARVCDDRGMLAAGDDFTEVLASLVALLVAPVGAAAGSVVRDLVVRRFRARAGRADLGILLVNLAACAVAGLCIALPAPWAALLVAGFAGGLSTWSALAVEVAGFLRARRLGAVALHILAACACALAVFVAAKALGGRP